jgi:23S rRNA C2498 (ribose-2'-O)-methylase RlmM
MAEIHILPAHLPGADQITRLSADLAAAQEQGVDLGSRVAHIHANGETLLSMCRGLERAFGALRQMLDQHGVRDQYAEDMVHRLIGEVHKLAACAQRFPSGP